MTFRMKKLLNVFLLLAAVFIASCSNEAVEKLAREVESFNKDCPRQFGTTVLRSIIYDKSDNEVVLTYIVDEKYTDMSTLSGVDAEQRRYLQAFLGSESTAGFLNDLVAAEASFCIRFEGNESGITESVSLSADELKAIDLKSTGDDNDREQLEGLVALANRQAPSEIIEGVTFSSVVLADSSIDYFYVYDPVKVTIMSDSLEAMRKLAAEELREELTAPESRQQFDIIRKLDLAVRLIYSPADTTAEEYKLVIISEEIAGF